MKHLFSSNWLNMLLSGSTSIHGTKRHPGRAKAPHQFTKAGKRGGPAGLQAQNDRDLTAGKEATRCLLVPCKPGKDKI